MDVRGPPAPRPSLAIMSERAAKKIKELQLKKSNTECFVCNTKVRVCARRCCI